MGLAGVMGADEGEAEAVAEGEPALPVDALVLVGLLAEMMDEAAGEDPPGMEIVDEEPLRRLGASSL